MFNRTVMTSLSVGILMVSSLTAQGPDTLWTRTYGGTNVDVCYSVCETSDGGYVLAGLTLSYGHGAEDVWLIKTDKSGDTLWTRIWGGPLPDAAHYVRETEDGGYLIVGYTESFGAGGKDLFLIKTDSQGNEEWTKTYGKTAQDVGYYVAPTSDGGYLVSGYINGPSDWIKGDLWILKIDDEGDTLWTRTYGGTGEEFGKSLKETPDGFVIVGTTSSSGQGGKDCWLVKTDNSGDTVWTKTYGAAQEDVCYSVEVVASGGYILTGYIDGYGQWTSGDLWLIRTDDSGDTLWTRRYGSPGEDHGFEILSATDGGFVISGARATNSMDMWLLKINGSGDTLWTRRYGGSQQDAGLALYLTSDGGYAAGGISESMGAGLTDFYLVKTRPVLELTNPKGGEYLEAGTPYTISWHVENSPKPPFSFGLFYSTDGGSSYEDTIALEVSPGDTAYVWTVPTDEAQSCRLKVELRDGNLETIAEDESDDNFIIGPAVKEEGSIHPSPRLVVDGQKINYYLPSIANVRIALYDPLGRMVTTLVDDLEVQGVHPVVWNGRDDANKEVPSGVYFIRFDAGDYRERARLILLK